jgi:hypothetical protein
MSKLRQRCSDSLRANDKRPNRIAMYGDSHSGDADGQHGSWVCVYEWIGFEILRHTWLNVDLIWTLALLLTGGLLLLG